MYFLDLTLGFILFSLTFIIIPTDWEDFFSWETMTSVSILIFWPYLFFSSSIHCFQHDLLFSTLMCLLMSSVTFIFCLLVHIGSCIQTSAMSISIIKLLLSCRIYYSSLNCYLFSKL